MRFERSASVNIRLINESQNGYRGDLSIQKLRIAFSIQKYLSWSTNSLNLRIWNLGSEKRAQIKDFGNQVRLNAGYLGEGGEQLIFLGDSNQTTHIFQQPDIITNIQCSDGERYLNNEDVTLSFKERTPVRTIIESLASLIGLDILQFAPSLNIVFEQGFEFSGSPKNALDKLVGRLGYQWGIQNNLLRIIPFNGDRNNVTHEVNIENGMIGYPERFTSRRQFSYAVGVETGWKVRTLLRPEIQAGDNVRLKSQKVNFEIDGIFYVYSVKHEGDTYSSQWETTLELILLP